MIWGVPVGPQTLHVDVDLSDIGCFSLRPDDFIRQGKGVDNFKNSYTYKASTDVDALPQIVSFDKTVEVYPFWPNHLQPMVTPAQGLTGRLLKVDDNVLRLAKSDPKRLYEMCREDLNHPPEYYAKQG